MILSITVMYIHIYIIPTYFMHELCRRYVPFTKKKAIIIYYLLPYGRHIGIIIMIYRLSNDEISLGFFMFNKRIFPY